MVLLFDDGSSRELMRGTDLHSDAERIEEARGHIRKDPSLKISPDKKCLGYDPSTVPRKCLGHWWYCMSYGIKYRFSGSVLDPYCI